MPNCSARYSVVGVLPQRETPTISLRLVEIARHGAVVVRLREFDRFHRVKYSWLLAVRASGRPHASSLTDVDSSGWMKIWNMSSVSACASRRMISAHCLIDNELTTIGGDLRGCGGVHLPYGLSNLCRRVDEGNRDAAGLEVLELRKQAVAEHLGCDAGAIRDEKRWPAAMSLWSHDARRVGRRPAVAGVRQSISSRRA